MSTAGVLPKNGVNAPHISKIYLHIFKMVNIYHISHFYLHQVKLAMTLILDLPMIISFLFFNFLIFFGCFAYCMHIKLIQKDHLLSYTSTSTKQILQHFGHTTAQLLRQHSCCYGNLTLTWGKTLFLR